MGRQRYSLEFRRRVVDRLADRQGVAPGLRTSDPAVVGESRTNGDGRGFETELSTREHAKLAVVLLRIAELEDQARAGRSLEPVRRRDQPGCD